MKLNDAILIPEQSAAKLESDDPDWLIGELDHAIDEANECGSLLYKWDLKLVRSALDFFRRYHQQLDLGGAKVDFDSVRISDEEWDRRFREKLRSICADPSAKRGGPTFSGK